MKRLTPENERDIQMALTRLACADKLMPYSPHASAMVSESKGFLGGFKTRNVTMQLTVPVRNARDDRQLTRIEFYAREALEAMGVAREQITVTITAPDKDDPKQITKLICSAPIEAFDLERVKPALQGILKVKSRAIDPNALQAAIAETLERDRQQDELQTHKALLAAYALTEYIYQLPPFSTICHWNSAMGKGSGVLPDAVSIRFEPVDPTLAEAIRTNEVVFFAALKDLTGLGFQVGEKDGALYLESEHVSMSERPHTPTAVLSGPTETAMARERLKKFFMPDPVIAAHRQLKAAGFRQSLQNTFESQLALPMSLEEKERR